MLSKLKKLFGALVTVNRPASPARERIFGDIEKRYEEKKNAKPKKKAAKKPAKKVKPKTSRRK